MNTAVRLLNQNSLSREGIFSVILARIPFVTSLLVLAVLTSALSVVYVTHATRSLTAAIQQTLVERDHLHVQWGQLLLERGTWVTQARIQHVAEQQLDMIIPERKSIIIIK